MVLFKNLSRHSDIALLLLRLAVAAAFINHGVQKWPLLQGIPEGMSSTVGMIIQMLASAEPLAGLALILGLLTRVANVGLMLVMLSALSMKLTGGMPMNVWEIDMLLLTMNIAIFILGPGAYAIDAKWMKKA